MSLFPFTVRSLGTLALLGGLAQTGVAATPQQLLGYKPSQSAEVSTPAATEIAACTVDLEEGEVQKSGRKATAWVLKDGQGRVLRKLHDSQGLGKVDIIAYYRDGEEAYRDIDSNVNGKMDQFRWLGPNGSKWGIDDNEDGKIDRWSAISAEEASQEILAAVIAKDVKKLDALMISDAELTALGLPAAEQARIKAKLAAAATQFAKTCADLKNVGDKTSWVHLETKLPQTVAADTLGSKADLVRYRQAGILYQEGEAKEGKEPKHNWLQAGELIQVGRAWRIIGAPTIGIETPEIADKGTGGDGELTIPEGGQKLVEELNTLDKTGPAEQSKKGIVDFNMKRAGILEKIAALYKPEEKKKRDVWLKQVADSLAAAAQQDDKPALERLTSYKAALAKDPTGAALPYFAYREMTATYAQDLPKLGDKPAELKKMQEGWKVKLTKFVTDFPAAEDTPDAIMQLGMVNEYFGSEMDAEAKAAYALLVKSFPTHLLAKRAQGSLDRLNLEGNAIDLVAPNLLNPQVSVDVKAMKGKAVVVYYWASWNDAASGDFAKMKLAMKDFAGKAELVGVNLDSKPADATAFIRSNQVEGTHVHLPGGLDSPLAVRYGIAALPVMFLVGPDGKVITRHVQASTLDDELKKAFKVEKTSKE